MYIINRAAVITLNFALVSSDFEYSTRIGVRLPPWCPPPSLTLSWVSKDDFLADLNLLFRSKSVSKFSSLFGRLAKPTHHANSDVAVIAEQFGCILSDGLKLTHLKRL
jgi:hypothetical protein